MSALKIPFIHERKKKLMDTCLDSFLTFFLIELETNASFERAFERAAERTLFPLRPELEKVLQRFRERGMPMDESLALLAEETNTPLLERTAGLLRHVYTHGSTSSSRDALQRMGEDVRTHQRTMWKAYAQKLVLLSLVFIGVSALVPALFLAFVTIGSRFLEMSLTPFDVLLLSLAGFPVLDTLVLAIVFLQTPPQPRRVGYSAKGAPFSFFTFFSSWKNYAREWGNRVDEVCLANGQAGGFSSLVFSSTLEGAGLFVVAWTIFLRAGVLDAMWVSIFLAACGGPFLFNVVWAFVAFEKHTHAREMQAADSLLVLSSIPSSVSFLDHLSWLGKTSPLPLREEWKKMVQEIRGGKSPREVLEQLGRGRNSPILDAVRALLIRTYESGLPFGNATRTLAHEIISHHAALHERRAVLLVEKYTILLAGGLLVPFLLGLLTGVVSTLPLSEEFTSPSSGELFEMALFGIRGYLFVYAILAGVFVGLLDGRPAQSVFYSLILLPSAQLVYVLGVWWTAH